MKKRKTLISKIYLEKSIYRLHFSTTIQASMPRAIYYINYDEIRPMTNIEKIEWAFPNNIPYLRKTNYLYKLHNFERNEGFIYI